MRSVMLCRYLINVLNKTPHRVQARRIVTNCTMVNNNARIFSRLQELPNINILSSLNSSMPLTMIVRKYKKETRNVNREIEDEDEDEDEDKESDEDDYSEIPEFAEDVVAQGHTPKKMIVFLPALRVDSVTAYCLNLSRNEVERQFYATNLYLNGKVFTKKSVLIKEGDYVDLCDKKSGKVMVRRIRLLKMLGTITKKNKTKTQASILVWKTPFEVPDDYYKSNR